MKLYIRVIIVKLSILVAPYTYAQCDFSDLEYNNYMKLNIEGGTVIANFSEHAFTQPKEIISIINNSDPADLEKELRDWTRIEKNQTFIKEQQTEVEDMVKFVKKTPVSWIGTERSELQYSSFGGTFSEIEDYKKMKVILRKKIRDKNLIKKILSSIYPTYVIAAAENPKRISATNIVPLENSETKNEATIVLFDIFDMQKEHQEQFDEEFKAIFQIVPGFEEANEAEIKALMKKNKRNSDDQEIILDYLKKNREFSRLNRVRDKEAADKIYSQSGDGLFIFGSAHKPGMLKHLKEKCESRKTENIKSIR
ncbi:MAG: hypothetical protein AB8E15_10520 [Bdellovibrionales bacterium]